MRDPADVAAAFDRALGRAGGHYAFVGGLAVSAWGQPRATQDVDCLLDLPPEATGAFVNALAAEGLKVFPGGLEAAPSGRSHVTILDEGSAYHVDCKLAVTADERAQVRDAKEVALPQGRLRVARAEDTVAYKVLFGSPQDLQDVRSILIRQAGRLDLGRLRALARRLGVGERVEELLSETSPAP